MNVTLTGVDPISLNVGSVLCRPGQIVPLASSFTAKIIVFDIQIPITAGTSVSAHLAVLGAGLTMCRLSYSTIHETYLPRYPVSSRCLIARTAM